MRKICLKLTYRFNDFVDASQLLDSGKGIVIVGKVPATDPCGNRYTAYLNSGGVNTTQGYESTEAFTITNCNGVVIRDADFVTLITDDGSLKTVPGVYKSKDDNAEFRVNADGTRNIIFYA